MVVRNGTAYLEALQNKTPVDRAVAAFPVAKLPMEAQLQEGVMSPGSSHPQIDCQVKAWETNQ